MIYRVFTIGPRSQTHHVDVTLTPPGVTVEILLRRDVGDAVWVGTGRVVGPMWVALGTDELMEGDARYGGGWGGVDKG